MILQITKSGSVFKERNRGQMLIEFTVGNYRSFKDPVTFSMVAAKLRAKDKTLDENNVFPLTDKISLLKSCAVYGANSSGKSNLVHAFYFMRWIVQHSATRLQVDEPINVDPFRLSTETENEPSFFEMVFFADGKRYRYGFIVDCEKIHSEWLYHVPKVKETNLFLREGDHFELSGAFKEGKGLLEKTRDNALFLSVVAQFNGTISQVVLRWFAELQVFTFIPFFTERHLLDYTIGLAEFEPLKDAIATFIKKLDMGISDFNVKKQDVEVSEFFTGKFLDFAAEHLPLPDLSYTVSTFHKMYDNGKPLDSYVLFDLDSRESEGTKKIFALAGLLLYILQNGKSLVIDELDARLHPLITEAIIQLFNSNQTNPNNAQLVFTTHDTNLLTNELFRRDQIWFTEKDKYGATDLYSLAEFKRIRNDASFEKDYITGKYGAIPFIGGLQGLIGKTNG